MRLYKLTDGDGKTFGGTQWGPGVSHSGTGDGEMCGPGWIHAYEHPLIAVLLNPIHAAFKSPRLWEAEGEVGLRDGQLKCGCKTLTTIREIPLPEITAEMWIRFAILCTKEASTAAVGEAWNAWADKWLSGEDRSAAAAAEAAAAAAATGALGAVGAARAAYDAAAWADEFSEAAAEAAYRAAWAASCCDIDLVAIAEKACAVSRK